MSIMKLSQPVSINDPYREIVLVFLHDYFGTLVWELRNHFGIELDIKDLPGREDDYLSLLIADSIADMVRVASGDTKDLDRAEIYEHVQGLVEKLFGIPGESSYEIPNAFWQSDFGAIVMAAFVWSQGDKLITISEAAQISGVSVKSISQYIARGKMKSYPDMSEPNPQKRTRVLKSEAKALR